MSMYKRFEASKRGIGIWEDQWQEESEFILPRKSTVQYKGTKGEKRTQRLFVSTAIHANHLLASAMQSTMTPSTSLWFMGEDEDEEIRNLDSVAQWYYDVSLIMWKEIKKSNFRSESFEVYLDLPALGNGCLFTDWGKDGLFFRTYFIGDYTIEEDEAGKVSGLFREATITVRQAHALWGDNIPDHMKVFLDKDPEHEVDIVHAVVKRGTLGSFKTNKPIGSFYLDKKTKSVIEEGGYDEMPYAVARWSKVSGEKYGRGQGDIAIPDIRTLNRAKELMLKKWNKDIDPPIDVPDEGISGQYKTYAGAINYVRPDLLGKISPHNPGVNLNENQINTQDLRNSIAQIFMIDQLKLREGPQKTAAEVNALVDEMQRLIGPALSRIETELLIPVLTRVFGLMDRRGMFPERPEELKGRKFNVAFIGPLAKAQRQNEVSSVDRWIGQIGAMAEVSPEVLDIPDFDGITRRYAELFGVAPDLVNDEDSVDETREIRAQQQEEAQQQEMIQQAVAKGGVGGNA